MKLLILEDSNFQRKILVTKLSELNCEITECAEAEDALIYLEAVKYDLVLTDLNLPSMNGVEFITQLRKFNKEVPIIAMTSPGSSPGKINLAIEAGASEVLNKPIEDLSPITNIIRKD
jgi:CheY-like chemotaxis protein